MQTEQTVDACVDFLCRLIQTPSMPGEEGAIGELVAAEMRRLAYDSVAIDDVGNVIGRIYGRDRTLPAILLNTHLDHVDPGERALWDSDPFGAEIVNGTIIGRGASDIKGPLAAQVYAAAAVAAGDRPQRDVVVTVVVEEEVGGAGAIHLAQQIDYPLALIVIGEPSRNNVAIGHRGLMHLVVTFRGRSAHASAPGSARNPNYALATFLTRLEQRQQQLRAHPRLGPTTVSPTLITVDTVSRNVTPAWAQVVLDFRTAAETRRGIHNFVRELADGIDAELELRDLLAEQRGLTQEPDDQIITGFDTDPQDPDVQRALDLIAAGIDRRPALTTYRFATDGRHFTKLGAPIIGFAPGDESVAHTANESIEIASLAHGLRGYMQLLRHY